MRMNLISIEDVSKTLNSSPLFQEVSLGINSDEKIGFIGSNGSGKSTFLHIINGDIPIDDGTISKNKDIRISFLEQTPNFPQGITLKEFLYLGNSQVITLLNTYYTYLQNYKHSTSEESTLNDLTEKMDTANGWNAENSYFSLLQEFHLPDSSAMMDKLSGGMLKKAALARALASNPNLLLLDEPTNHLDIETIEWLEAYLANAAFAFIMVTHDRYFLDRACTKIMEIDKNKIFLYNGNYSTYLQRKAERFTIEQNEQSRIRAVLKDELEWLKRGPRARAGKDKKRKSNIQKLIDANVQTEDQSIEFSSAQRRLGKKVLELKQITKLYDRKSVINSFSYNFKKGERIGIIGPNGAGKSTFLNIIAEYTAPDSGTVDTGLNTHIGYYDQLSSPLHGNKTVLEFIEKTAERVTLANGLEVSAARFLEIFQFPTRTHRLQISSLSGGEKRRLYLITILAGNPNFLMLDEPTNDLDIVTLQKLEEYCNTFSGTLLIVSHDRAFLDRTTDYLFIFNPDGTIQRFTGNYSGYNELMKQSRREEQKPVKTEVMKKKVDTTKRKLTFKERKEMETLFKDLDELENEKERLEKSFTDTSLSPQVLSKNSMKYNTLLQKIENKTIRWETLAEYEDVNL